jgi:hypothetical protein
VLQGCSFLAIDGRDGPGQGTGSRTVAAAIDSVVNYRAEGQERDAEFCVIVRRQKAYIQGL